MSTDGAQQNIPAESAMKFIVGGGEYPEALDDLSFEAMIREAPLTGDLGYEGGANAAARLILEAYERYPQTRELAEDHLYLANGEDGKIDWNNPIYLTVTLYDVIKKIYPQHQEEIWDYLTGFMWGWAVNAARKIAGLSPRANPAIMEISVDG